MFFEGGEQGVDNLPVRVVQNIREPKERNQRPFGSQQTAPALTGGGQASQEFRDGRARLVVKRIRDFDRPSNWSVVFLRPIDSEGFVNGSEDVAHACGGLVNLAPVSSVDPITCPPLIPPPPRASDQLVGQ